MNVGKQDVLRKLSRIRDGEHIVIDIVDKDGGRHALQGTVYYILGEPFLYYTNFRSFINTEVITDIRVIPEYNV